MDSISVCYNDVNFRISENSLIDTFRFRVGCEHSYYAPNHYGDAVKLDGITIAADRYNGGKFNFYNPFFDFETSVSALLFGDNHAGYSHESELYKNFDWQMNRFQLLVRSQFGGSFNAYRASCSRLHIAVNFDCYTPENAVSLRDNWYEFAALPHLKNKKAFENTRYFNCRSYNPDDDDKRRTYKDGSLIQSNKTFALYPVGSDLRGELRFNNSASVRALFRSKLGKALKLVNNFRYLSQPHIMNAIFWDTAINLFDKKDREIIKTALSF